MSKVLRLSKNLEREANRQRILAAEIRVSFSPLMKMAECSVGTCSTAESVFPASTGGQEDVIQGVRKSALTEDLEKIGKIYIERNGEITAVKKEV